MYNYLGLGFLTLRGREYSRIEMAYSLRRGQGYSISFVLFQ